MLVVPVIMLSETTPYGTNFESPECGVYRHAFNSSKQSKYDNKYTCISKLIIKNMAKLPSKTYQIPKIVFINNFTIRATLKGSENFQAYEINKDISR